MVLLAFFAAAVVIYMATEIVEDMQLKMPEVPVAQLLAMLTVFILIVTGVIIYFLGLW